MLDHTTTNPCILTRWSPRARPHMNRTQSTNRTHYKYWICAGKKLVKVSQWKQCVIFCFSLSHPLFLFCMLGDHTLSLSAFSHTSVPTFLYTKTNIIFVILLLVLSLPWIFLEIPQNTHLLILFGKHCFGLRLSFKVGIWECFLL